MSIVVAAAKLAGACQSFLDHWKSLRNGALVPSLDVWLTHLPASIATHEFRAELLPTDALVLFNGSANTARRGRNNTGGSLLDEGDESTRRANLNRLRDLVSQPCGLLVELRFQAADAMTLRTQTIILPLSFPSGRRPQVVGYTCDLERAQPNVVFRASPERTSTEWLDIGGGIPAASH